MSPKGDPVVVLFLGVVGPILALPSVVGHGREWVVATAALSALVVAVRLLVSVGAIAWPAGLFAVTVAVGWVRAVMPISALEHAAGVALGLLVMASLAATVRDRRALATVTLLVVALGVGALSLGYRSVVPPYSKVLVAQPGSGPGQTSPPLPLRRWHLHTTVNPNALAATALMILPLAFAAARIPFRSRSARTVLRAGALSASAGAAVLIVVMQSRGAWMALLLTGWIAARRVMRTSAWLGSGVIIGITLVGLVLAAPSAPQVSSAVSSLKARAEIWQGAMEALQLSPWLGIGVDQFRYTHFAPQFYTIGTHFQAVNAHQFFLQTALDVGLVGLGAYLCMIGGVLRRGLEVLRGPRDWVGTIALGSALSVGAVHAYGLVDSVSLGAKVGVFQWLACGLILAAWRVRTSSEET